MEKIGIFTPTHLPTSIEIEQIVTLHYFEYTKDFKFGGEKHDFWEMVYVDRGEVGVLADRDGLDLHQGEAIFHKPNEYHNIWAKGRYANIIVLSFISHSPAMRFFENKIITLDESHQAILARIVAVGESCFVEPLNLLHQTRMLVDPAAPFGCPQVIKNYMELLFIELVQSKLDFSRLRRASRTTKMQGDDQIVEAITAYLEENICGSINLSDILETFCFSKSYLTKLFREKTGSSIMEYYNGLKITEAQRLISERELSFTEIAERLGFASIHYFSRMFKKKTGMTPSEYGRSVRSMAVL